MCRVCKIVFNDWDELAHHVNKLSKIKGSKHRKTLWVESRIHKNAIDILTKPIKKFEPPVPLTDEQKQNKVDSRRELSGETKLVMTYCPECKKRAPNSILKTPQRIEVEYILSEHAVKNEKGEFAILCNAHRRK